MSVHSGREDQRGSGKLGSLEPGRVDVQVSARSPGKWVTEAPEAGKIEAAPAALRVLPLSGPAEHYHRGSFRILGPMPLLSATNSPFIRFLFRVIGGDTEMPNRCHIC